MAGFTRIPIPRSRRFVVDAGAIALERPIIHGLFAADVTDIRPLLRAAGPDGSDVSLTAYLVWCLGRAVRRHPSVHGYVHRGHIVVFDEVDATVIVETESEGMSFPRAHVVRDVGGRDLLDIHAELVGLRATSRGDTQARVRSVGWLLVLPSVVRRWLYRAYLREPSRRKRLMGTVAVTAVGMHGSRGFWGIGVPQHTLQLVVGGIERRPAVRDGETDEREMLSLTVAVDHDVVDGAPAVRFADDLAALIEDGEALEAELTSPHPW